MNDNPVFEKLILARGLTDWGPCDHPNVVVVTASRSVESVNFIAASRLNIDGDGRVAVYRLPSGESVQVPLETAGHWHLVTPKFCREMSLPLFALHRHLGIIEAKEWTQDLHNQFHGDDVVVVGTSEWSKENIWCSSPMGLRRKNLKWTQFVPLGGQIAVAIDLKENLPQGIGANQLELTVFQKNHLEDLTTALRLRRLSRIPNKLYLHGADIREAIALVSYRKAFGAIQFEVSMPKALDPSWRRLVQHVGGAIKYIEKSPMDLVSTHMIVDLLPPIDVELALKQVNQHSDVIPPGLLKLFPDKAVTLTGV